MHGLRRDQRQPQRACSENIEHSVFIGADGRVSPCVFAGIPVRGDNFFYTQDKEHLLRSRSFGNVKTTTLGTIWRSKKHRAFRKQFGKSALWPGCVPCLKRRVESLEPAPELVP